MTKPRMQGMSEREYARRAGLSRGAIQAAKRSGRLVLFADGSIDPEASDRRLRAATHPGRSFAAETRWKRARGQPEPAPAARIEHLPPPSLDPRLPEAIADTLGALLRATGGLDYRAARTVHAIVRAYSAQLEAARAQGELVDRAEAERVITAIARAERDAWLAWPARISAILAAEVGCDPGRLETALVREVRAQLETLASPELDLSAIAGAAAEG